MVSNHQMQSTELAPGPKQAPSVLSFLPLLHNENSKVNSFCTVQETFSDTYSNFPMCSRYKILPATLEDSPVVIFFILQLALTVHKSIRLFG